MFQHEEQGLVVADQVSNDGPTISENEEELKQEEEKVASLEDLNDHEDIEAEHIDELSENIPWT